MTLLEQARKAAISAKHDDCRLIDHLADEIERFQTLSGDLGDRCNEYVAEIEQLRTALAWFIKHKPKSWLLPAFVSESLSEKVTTQTEEK